MKVNNLEVVTVCVNYSDFLKETAPYNSKLFDKWIIVTDPQDEKTQSLCNKLNLECLVTDDSRNHLSKQVGFNKGRLIERGLIQTSENGWKLHLDCDMVLPGNFRQLLNSAELHEDSIYGIDRTMIPSYEEWIKVTESPYLNGSNVEYNNKLQFLKDYKLGFRWVDFDFGYCPIGYFQLFHSSQYYWRKFRKKTYPINHDSASRTDIQFAMKWDRNKRGLIPEIIALHLESGIDGSSNWFGRKSKEFKNEAIKD